MLVRERRLTVDVLSLIPAIFHIPSFSESFNFMMNTHCNFSPSLVNLSSSIIPSHGLTAFKLSETWVNLETSHVCSTGVSKLPIWEVLFWNNTLVTKLIDFLITDPSALKGLYKSLSLHHLIRNISNFIWTHLQTSQVYHYYSLT